MLAWPQPPPADGTLKLWDLRKLKGGPLATADGLPCSYSMTQCCFSPDEDRVLTGTSAEGKDAAGSLVVLAADSLAKLGEVEVDGSAVAVQVRLPACPTEMPRGPAGLRAGPARLPPACLLAGARCRGGGPQLASSCTLSPSARSAPRLAPPTLQWHPRINQIFVGCGGRSSGSVRTFYDPGGCRH